MKDEDSLNMMIIMRPTGYGTERKFQAYKLNFCRTGKANPLEN